MKKVFFTLITITALSLISFESKAQGIVKGGPAVTLTSDQPFNCTSMTLTVISVNNNTVIAQDACGNTYSLNGNTMGLTSGSVIRITVTSQNGNAILFTVVAN